MRIESEEASRPTSKKRTSKEKGDQIKRAKASDKDCAHLSEALYKAIFKGDAKIVRMLLDYGANFNSRSFCVKSTLIIAVNFFFETVKIAELKS